jgi:hypothetical protein
MLDGIAARIARMRAEYRDQACENSADQRQKTTIAWIISGAINPSSD